MGFFSAFDWVNEAVRSPTINWKPLLASFIVGHTLFDLVINVLEYGVQCRKEPPRAVSELMEVDDAGFKKSQDYKKAKLRVSIISDIYEAAINLALLKNNAMAKLWYYFQPLVARYLSPRWFGDGTTSVLAILTLSGLSVLLAQPLELYSTFVVEETYGFNKMSLGLHFKDTVKKLLLGLVFMPLIFGGVQKIIEYTGDKFVVYLLGFFFAIGILAQFLMPTLILPLFSKYEPLEEGELRTKIEQLAARLNFPLTRLYVEDGSTRSAHSNAYFIGLPWYKQIVIFDTLIKEQPTEQIVAVLAHELGHWKHTHIPILMATGLIQSAFTFAPLAFFLYNKHFFSSMGFTKGPEMPILVAVSLFGDALAPLTIALQFVNNYITRLCEYDADNFAANLGYGANLSKSLIDLSKSNLSSIDQHPVYSTYHNSHPRTSERLTALKQAIKKHE